MKVMSKGFFAAIIVMLCMLAVLKIDAKAANVVESKTMDDITWTMYDDGSIVFSGAGTISCHSGHHKYSDKIKKVTIEPSVTAIEKEAFINFQYLKSVSVPSSVTIIGYRTFRGCSSLTNINIPSSVTTISDSAFYGCSSLTNINIPSSVTTISSSAFAGCSSLTSVSIPSSVTSIASSTFAGCSSLTSISIPSSVTSIMQSAFAGCSSLTSVSIPSSVTFITSGTFRGCSSLTKVSIPSSVTTIGYQAFHECSSLISINIPSSVTAILSKAFYGCSSLTSISIPSSVTDIENEAFCGCTSLVNVEISDQLLNSIDIDKVFEATLWLMYKKGGTITGTAGDFKYLLDEKGNLSLTGSGNFKFDSKYSDWVKTVIISRESGAIGNYTSFSWVNVFPNIEKLINESSCEVSFEDGYGYSWCNGNDLTEPIYYLSKGTAVKVNEKLVKHYNIIFDGNGATSGSMENIRSTANTSQTLPPNAYSKKGYCFNGWQYLVGDYLLDVYDESYIYFSDISLQFYHIEDLTLVAQWKKDPDYGIYSIIFEGNGETSGSMSSITTEADKPIKIPDNDFSKNGYIFKNWSYQVGNKSYTLNNGSSLLISSDDWETDKITSITLIAQWTKNAASTKAVNGVTLNKKSASIAKGKTITLKATVKPTDATNKSVTWKSSNTKIATVDQNGKITGKKAGTAKITVTTADGSKIATCKVTVTEPVKSIRFSKRTYSIKAGKTVTLKTTITPNSATNKNVTFKCSDKKVATVDKNGKVKGVKKGKVKITVTTKDGKKKATCTVVVK